MSNTSGINATITSKIKTNGAITAVILASVLVAITAWVAAGFVPNTNELWVSNFASCAGNDAVDDSVGINAAITQLSAAGGGVLRFNNGTDCRVKNPIIIQQFVRLKGAGRIVNVSPGIGSVIRPSANLSAIITQASLTTFIHSAAIEDLTIDGRNSSFTVTNLLDLYMVNGTVRNNFIANGSGNCVKFEGSVVNGAPPDWINWIDHNYIAECVGDNILFQGSDTWIVHNYTTGALSAADIVIAGFGGVRVEGNQIEDAASGTGLIIQSAGASCAVPEVAVIVVGNFLTQNNINLHMELGACAATALEATVVDGNTFSVAGTEDILIDSGLTNGSLGTNNFVASAPSAGHIVFGGPTNTGWAIATSAYRTGITPFVNLPPDAQVTGGPMTQIYGSNTVLGQANVAARFGVQGGLTSLNAAAMVGVANGTIPFFGCFSGETQALAGCVFRYQATVGGSITSPWSVGANGFTLPAAGGNLTPVTISALLGTTCAAGNAGQIAYVKDTVGSAAATFHGAIAGSGSTTVAGIATCNGSNWQWG